MASLKIVCVLAILAIVLPTFTSAAETPEVTTSAASPAEEPEDGGDTEGFPSSDPFGSPFQVPFWGGSFWRYFRFLREFIYKKQQQYIAFLSQFDTEKCAIKQNGPCTFDAVVSINGNCSIYTIGNCESNVQMLSNPNCVHKCQLPATDNSGNTGAPVPAESTASPTTVAA